MRSGGGRVCGGERRGGERRGGEGGGSLGGSLGEAAVCLRIFLQLSPPPSILRDSGTSGEKTIQNKGETRDQETQENESGICLLPGQDGTGGVTAVLLCNSLGAFTR